YKRKETQSGKSDYSYTLYDGLGRIVEVGEKTDNTAGIGLVTFAEISNDTVNGKISPYVINAKRFNSWALNGSVRREVTHTTYDTTLFNLSLPLNQENLRKRVSVVTYEDKNDGNELTYQHATYYS